MLSPAGRLSTTVSVLACSTTVKRPEAGGSESEAACVAVTATSAALQPIAAMVTPRDLRMTKVLSHPTGRDDQPSCCISEAAVEGCLERLHPQLGAGERHWGW